MSSGIAELVRTAPDWTRVDALSAEVKGWLDRALQTIEQLDAVEAGILRVHLQYLHNDIVRHGSQIVETLRRVEKLA